MASEKKKSYWLGHPVRDVDHARQLHMKAAIAQYHKGMSKEDAEAHAKDEDRRERHAQAAAHHLMGMKASNAVGNKDAAERHFDFYSLHMRALGHSPMDAVPAEVQKFTKPDGKKQDHYLDFKSHDDDQFLVEPVKKSEDLAKADEAPLHRAHRPKEFSAAKTFLRDRRLPEHRVWDYSTSDHVPDELFKQGYRMYVLSHGPHTPIRVHMLHHPQGAGPTWGTKVGGVTGNVHDGDLGIDSYYVHPEHAGRGIDSLVLNAAMSHAKNHMGARSLSYGEFTPEAGDLIEAMAQPHGLELGEVEETSGPRINESAKPGHAKSDDDLRAALEGLAKGLKEVLG